MRTGTKAYAIAAVTLAAMLVPSVAAGARRNVYVSGEGSSNVFVYDVNASTGALSTITGSPFAADSGTRGIAVNPAGTRLYATNLASNYVSAFNINASTGALTTIGSFPTGGTGSAGIAINPAGTRLYVSNIGSASVSAFNINASTGALTQIGSPVAAGTSPVGVAINPAATRLYVSNFTSGSISAYNISPSDGSLTQIGSPVTDGVGVGVSGVVMNPIGTRLYIANAGPGNIAAYNINPADGTLAQIGSPVAAGTNPVGVAINPAGTRLYAANQGSDSVSTYGMDPSNGSLEQIGSTIPAGDGPSGVAVNPAGTRLYVSNVYSHNVSTYSISASGTLTETVGPVATATSPNVESVAITPNQTPNPNFTSAAAAAGSATTFNASSSSDDAGIATYDWNFGDGQRATNAGPTPAHTYSAAGTYNVTLTVNDGEGCTGFLWASWTAFCNGSSIATKVGQVTVAAASGGGGSKGKISIGAIKSGENGLTATLTCSGGTCDAKVSVATKRKYSYGKKRRGKRRARKKQLVLGSKTFSLAADHKANAKIVYSKKVLKQLKKLVLKGPFKRKGRKVPVVITVTSGAKIVTRNEMIKFKVKKKRKKRR